MPNQSQSPKLAFYVLVDLQRHSCSNINFKKYNTSIRFVEVDFLISLIFFVFFNSFHEYFSAIKGCSFSMHTTYLQKFSECLLCYV